MFDLLYSKLTDPHFLLSLLVAIATMATIVTVAMPLLETDTLAQRMKSVATERERIRARERERLLADKGKANLRQAPKAYMKRIVERFSLSKWLGTEQAKVQMAMAGFRGPQAEVAFLFFRLVTPAISLLITAFYIFAVDDFGLGFILKLGVVIFATYFGLKLPELYLTNTIGNRQHSIGRAFPDAMDLLLICVESGMSIEHAFRKVAQEIGVQSIPLAEELTLTTAELSFLPDRRTAYENLGVRTGVEIGQTDRDRAHSGGALWHAAWHGAAGGWQGKPRQPDDACREKGRGLAAKIDGADDFVFSSRAVRDHHDTRNHSD